MFEVLPMYQVRVITDFVKEITSLRLTGQEMLKYNAFLRSAERGEFTYNGVIKDLWEDVPDFLKRRQAE